MTEDIPLPEELSPPMANGELMFDAPWQSRTFGMARTLCEAGVFTWDEFRAELIACIEQWESAADTADDYEYWSLFLEALTQLLAQRELVVTDELQHRSDEYAGRPHGHDH